MVRSNVDLPAPLAPSSAVTSLQAAAVIDRSWSAGRPATSTLSPSISSRVRSCLPPEIDGDDGGIGGDLGWSAERDQAPGVETGDAIGER